MQKQTFGNNNEITLYHGDCLEILPDLEGIDAVITAIPFGQIKQQWDNLQVGIDGFRESFRVVKPEGAVVTFATMKVAVALINEFPKLFRYDLVWRKNMAVGFLNSKKMPLRNHEMILVFGQKLGTYNPQFTYGHIPYSTKNGSIPSRVYGTARTAAECLDGKRYPKSVLDFNTDKDRHHVKQQRHPTQKPSAAMEWLVNTYTNECETVLDPFMGIGTTGVACLRTGRRFIGIEKESEYFNLACERIEDEMKQESLF